ncbi:MAG TPA: LamG-like jellyroll fold domain-containing protein [Bacteroidia bacterium]|nr:LamG-like jellyroll fold domain-containing protein [Bacteroidia bacterium]
MKRLFYATCFLFLVALVGLNNKVVAGPGDTTVVQTFYYDTTMRAGEFLFPSDTAIHYEKIIMLYSMRCKDGLVSTSSNTNLGCGEWDYNCYTFVVDSSQTDSLRTTASSYLISGVTDTVFNYTIQPLYAYTQYNQQQITYTNTLNETTAVVGAGSASLTFPLGASAPVSRTQFLWTAGELTSAGFTADSITGIRLDLQSLGSSLNNLRIRFKNTTQTALNGAAPELTGFTETYFLNTTLPGTGVQSFNFHTPFWWDGVSNIIVEFSYSNTAPGTDNTVAGDVTGFTSAITSAGADRYIAFNNNTSILKLNTGFNSTVTNEITIAFWVYGDPANLPAKTSIMEAYDASGKRQVNMHLPWNDSNIYWDCGNDGTGYDRINKLATASEIAGQWNFWTFTKNATTGDMKIYLNGNLWHSGTGKTKPIDIQQFVVGNGIGSGAGYYGKFDELSIWNKELSQSAIQLLMAGDITPSNPDYAFLKLYHQFNEPTGTTAVDASLNGYNGELINPTRYSHNGTTLFRNFAESAIRPNTTFVSGNYVKNILVTQVLDSVAIPAVSVQSFAVDASGHSLQAIDTLFVWPAGYSYIFDENGIVIDSIAAPAQNTVNVTPLTYYNVRPMYMELINFITPYGINLNLDGLNGKTWAFDVTDFAPVLKGMRHLEMRDGINQEDIDIKFVFYEGTPPRDIKSVSEIWPSGSWVSPSYNDILSDKYFEPRDIVLDANASQFKIRSAISGHGQQGEFTPRTHIIKLNNTINFSRSVWKECATNPIYPQGGTWVYDRAGWCPGAAVDLKEFEITPNVTPGQTINLDYSLPVISNPGASNYRINNQLVSYGPPNFTLDAAVDYIKTPSKRVEFERLNPLCNEPVIAIKNTGSTNLTSLTITYGRKGGTMSTYNWSGNLAFLQSIEVALPQPAWLSSSVNEFVAYVSNPNGGTDQYAYNDTLTSAFNTPAQLSNYLVFELKTNNLPAQNSYTLKDAQGGTIITRSSLSANTVYRDTVNLLNDCYIVSLNDAGDDGLTWWANSSQGSGYFRIRNANSGVVEMTFNSDFGDNIYQQFTVGYVLPVPEVNAPIQSFRVFPNPASDILNTEFSMPLNSKLKIRLMNVLGSQILSETVTATQPVEKFELDVSSVESGIYYVIAESGTNREVRKVVITR